MSIDFNIVKCQTHSNKKIFGLCDDPSPAKNPAYIDEVDGAKWIAVVENEDKYAATFTAIDNCIEIKREDCIILNIFRLIKCSKLLKTCTFNFLQKKNQKK